MALIEAGQFTPFRDAIRLMLDLRAAGIQVAAASSSKNATRMMAKLRLDTLADEYGLAEDFVDPGQTLLDLLDADVSGRTFEHGKPHPEIFLTVCRELGLAPKIVLRRQDAVPGIAAAKAGGMAALGVARTENSQPLSDAGADLVVATLDEVDRGPLRDGRLVRVVPAPPTHAPARLKRSLNPESDPHKTAAAPGRKSKALPMSTSIISGSLAGSVVSVTRFRAPVVRVAGAASRFRMSA